LSSVAPPPPPPGPEWREAAALLAILLLFLFEFLVLLAVRVVVVGGSVARLGHESRVEGQRRGKQKKTVGAGGGGVERGAALGPTAVAGTVTATLGAGRRGLGLGLQQHHNNIAQHSIA
jgi:hypothetical protein